MDATRGIHALATTIFFSLLFFVTYDYFASFYSGVTYDVFKYILWGTYIIMIVVCTGLVPTIIAMSTESDASFISAFAGLGMYVVGAIVMRVATPIAEAFVGTSTRTGILEGTTINNSTGILTASQSSQAIGWISVLWIVAVVFLLILLPVTAAIAPEMYEPAIKRIQE